MNVCFRLLVVVGLLISVSLPVQADDDIETVASLLEILIDADPDSAKTTLATLASKVQTGELSDEQTASLKARLGEMLGKVIAQADHPLAVDAALLAATWRDAAALGMVRKVVGSAKQSNERRIAGFDAILVADDEQAIDLAAKVLGDVNSPLALRSAVLASLGRTDAPKVAEVVLQGYAKYEAELQPKAIELLTQRTAWSKSLLAAIGEGKVAANVLNANQVARLQASPDEELKKLVQAKWGMIRTERNPQREQVVQEMRLLLRDGLGDPHNGAAVFQKVCGQCHKLYGQGQDVGPEITANGRSSFEQLLSNVFDPSLVIGVAYQARQVVTDEGRVLTGLVTEENEQRIVLKMQGGKIETIPRDEIEEMKVSPLSLMPEGLENQLKREEIADLFAYLALDRPPSDPQARYLPGTPVGKSPK
jgi:putative heme-binding domain-containing protein